jgi:hypothetical protein
MDDTVLVLNKKNKRYQREHVQEVSGQMSKNVLEVEASETSFWRYLNGPQNVWYNSKSRPHDDEKSKPKTPKLHENSWERAPGSGEGALPFP